jgi:uncharacterized protein
MQNHPVFSLVCALIVLSTLLLGSSRVIALPVTGLYGQEIAVSNQSEAERRRAYREALAQVIVKVTGERRWLEHPQIVAALAAADRYVAEVSYGNRGATAALDVRFDQRQIDDLLHRENIPVWDNNRASILLWLTVQSADGRRVTLGSSSEHALLDQVHEFSARRAVPVLIPLLDLEDRRLVTPDQAWALDAEALQRAAERYGADSVLAARVLETPDGQLVGLWNFLFRDSEDIFDEIAPLTTYIEQPLDRATTRLARHFGLVLSQFEQSDAIVMRIDGIDSLPGQQQLLRYLESLTVVSNVRMAGLRPDGLDVRLELSGTRQMLIEFISLGRDLQRVGGSAVEQSQDLLHYRWTR